MAVAAQAMPFSHLANASDTFSNRLEDANKATCSIEDTDLSAAQRWLEAQQQNVNSQTPGDTQSFFDFEPQVDSAPFAPQYPSLPDANLTPGWNTISPQMPSPPASATSPPSSWPPFRYHQPPPVHNILTDISPDTKMQYGQNTPPDEEFQDLFAAEEHSHIPPKPDPQPSLGSAKKRKRQSGSIDSKTSAPKRSRKYGRSVDSSSGQAPSGAEEVRRSKFLERNRIAASKCRQKKKEWTQNLENRARELQKGNQSLRMVLDSLRDEMLFLKGEMLKHTTCGCEEIQGWVKSSADSYATSPVIKTEHSPINSAPASRRGSVGSPDSGYYDEQPTSPEQHLPRRSKSPDTRNLEGLLLDQLVHDTSDRGISQSLQAVA